MRKAISASKQGVMLAALFVLVALSATFWMSSIPTQLSAAGQVEKRPRDIKSCPSIDDAACLPQLQVARVPPIRGAVSTDEQALRNKALRRLEGVNTVIGNSHPVIVSVQVEGNWAVIDAVWAFDASDVPVASETWHVIGKKTERWRVALPGSARFLKWLDAVPVSLLSQLEKNYYEQLLAK